MLPLDALVTDLIFAAGDGPDPEVLFEAIGGEEAAAKLKVLDPDMQDARFEMEVSPSRPFRRRTERRLLMVADSTAPMREDPRAQPVIEVDLRDAKETLISACEKLGDTVRLGRLFTLGSWGEAVMVARSAVDLRAWVLQAWILDPNTDVRGKRRSQPLSQPEFEEKLAAYELRLEELSEAEILASLGPASLERRGDWLVVSVLDGEGHWDLRQSVAFEQALAAVDKFSIIPGAPGGQDKKAAEPEPEPEPEPKSEVGSMPESLGPALTLLEGHARPLFLFPAERFDLDVAATLGKGDWQSVLHSSDADGRIRDRVFEHGAGFVAPVEFLSEVFVDGRPLSKPQFESDAEKIGDARILPVHFPRFGPATLIILDSGERFITSEASNTESIVEALRK